VLVVGSSTTESLLEPWNKERNWRHVFRHNINITERAGREWLGVPNSTCPTQSGWGGGVQREVNDRRHRSIVTLLHVLDEFRTIDNAKETIPSSDHGIHITHDSADHAKSFAIRNGGLNVRVHVHLHTPAFCERKECVTAQAAIANIRNDCYGVALLHSIAWAAGELYQLASARRNDMLFG
jgi:hypothetical protein